MLPMIYLHKRVIGSQASVAAFIYALFFNANCVAMIVSDTPLSRTLLTVGMTVLLVWLFAKELRYIADEKSILRTDRHFACLYATARGRGRAAAHHVQRRASHRG